MKKIIVTALTALSLLMLAACGSKEGIDTSKTAAEIITQATELNQDIKSVDASGNAVLNMTFMETAADTKISYDMSFFTDPEKIKMDMSISMMGESYDSTAYVQKADDVYEVYTDDGTGTWTKETIDVSAYDAMLSGMSGDSTAYIQDMLNLEKAGEETLDEAKTVKITGSMSADTMNSVMDSTDMADTYSELFGLTDSTIAFEGNVPMSVWIEISTGHILKVEMDLTEVMQNFMTSLIESISTGEEEDYSDAIEIQAYTMEMTYSNYNSATEFEIPAEASAVE